MMGCIMMENGPVLAIRDHNDETALSQLGAATVLLWQKLPQDIRSELLGLVVAVNGIRRSRDCNERLARLIETNQPWSGCPIDDGSTASMR